MFDEVYDMKNRDTIPPFTFALNNGSIIAGLDEAVKSMKVGEVAIVHVIPDYAYGRLGCPPRIPANSDLIFEVELVGFDKPKEVVFFDN